MNIWLDDQRDAPEGWVHLHNIDEVEHLVEIVQDLKEFNIETMSFDFHLAHPKRGVDVMQYLADLCVKCKSIKYWPETILYHSSDPKGVIIMKDFVENFERTIKPNLLI